MPRRGFDSIRRMPIVVIPRKRKYKNYVSRRRNTQLIANLRRCFSDPVLYRSYNHWEGLSRPFSPEKPSSSFTFSTHAAPIAVIPETVSFDSSMMKAEAKARKEFTLLASKKSELEEGKVFGEVMKSMVQENERSEKGRYKDNRKLSSDFQLSNVFDLEVKRAGIATNYSDNVILGVNNEGGSLAEIAFRAPTPPTTSRIRPRNLASRSVVLSRTTTIETPLIKRRLLGCAKYQKGNGSDRKDYHREYVNLPSGSNNLDEREEERTAERKAQNTVTAVTAAFSTLTLEPQQTKHEREAVAEQTNNAGAITVAEVREAVGATGELAIRRFGETEKPVPSVSQQMPNISTANNNNTVGTSNDSGLRKSRNAAPQPATVGLIPPLSTRRLKQTKISHNSLLATLQLPPSVSAKVDRIIANAERKEKERCSNHAVIDSVSFSLDIKYRLW